MDDEKALLESSLEAAKVRDIDALVEAEEPLTIKVGGQVLRFAPTMTTAQYIHLQAHEGKMDDRAVLNLFGVPAEVIDILDPKRMAATVMVLMDHFFARPQGLRRMLRNPQLIEAAYSIGLARLRPSSTSIPDTP